MSEDIKITFIIRKDCTNEFECSEDMKLAFLTCEGHRGGGLQPRWVKESEISKFDGLTKRDVFVLNEFAGEIFEKLRATKCLLVGPRCLSCCLTEGSPIPSGPEPVFTVAMKGLVVTASGLSKQQKESIKRKVQRMGGIYNSALTDDTTHLVSDTVLSDKYIKSIEKGIPVMKETWIEAVWDTSLRLNVSGASPEFDSHRLPPFANLQLTTSGITKREKLTIMKLIQEGGGMFSGAFQSETTDVVVLTKEGVGSEKYKAALEYGKACVLPAWVKDSACKGVALPVDKYRVVGASTSSPFAEHRLPDMSLNFSRITSSRGPSNFVDESKAVDISTISGRMKVSQDPTRKSSDGVDTAVATAFDNFDMSTIKKAGPIFDGFCIWVSGPEGAWRERASACVSRGGGVRYDGPHERVTHIVAGNKTAAAAASKELPAVPVLSPLWLLRSVQAKKPLDEIEYLIEAVKPRSPVPSSGRKRRVEHAAAASPMSKRNLQLLTSPRHPPPPASPPHPPSPPPPGDDELVNHYLSQQAVEPVRERTPERQQVQVTCEPDITDDADEPTEHVEQIFRDMRIEVQGLEEEAICEIGAEVSAAGGCLVAAGAGGTYALCPLDFDTDELSTRGAEPVTVFWVKDCLSQQELVPVQYYHRPVRVPAWGVGRAPLLGVVASLSTYSGVERAFLDELAKLLGATTQLRFCRRTTSTALASTHLICPTPTGDKYMGCVKWGLPAVTADWLLKCAETGTWVPEDPYLLPDTKAPERPAPTKEPRSPPLPPPPCAEGTVSAPAHGDVTDKENAMLAPPPPPAADNTPRHKLATAEPEAEMSPASRYIAMARQGLLGCDSQETPKRVGDVKADAKQGDIRTPPLEDALSTPNLRCLSPTTRRRLQAVKRGEMPSDPVKTPNDPFCKTETPDSAFGAALRPGSGRMSPDARKRLREVVDLLPTKEPTPAKGKQTPLSEIRNRFLAQFNGDAPKPPSDHHTTAPRKLFLQEHSETPPSKMAKFLHEQSPSSVSVPNSRIPDASAKSAASEAPVEPETSSALPAAVDAQLERLSAALSGRNSSPASWQRRRDSLKPQLPGPEPESGPESQPNTVGWDDTSPQNASPIDAAAATPQIKRFMLSSNVDNREELISMINYLGGEVSDCTELDPRATHLLCCAPGRSEKMLGSIAHGKWILHPAYVSRSRQAGAFVQEEEFEWGNPRAACLPPLGANERTLANAAYRWRHARANKQPGPFTGVVALLHVPAARRRLLTRLIVAGDGVAPEIEPPYTDDSINVCFADIKRYPLSERDAAWLKAMRVPVCAPVVLSAYLTEEVRPDPHEHCLPDFKP